MMPRITPEWIKLYSIFLVLVVVPNDANAETGFDLKNDEHVVLTTDTAITNDINIESANRFTAIAAAGNASIDTNGATLTINADTATSGGRNYIFDTITPGTNFTFTGNLTAVATGTDDTEARGIRLNAAASATFDGVIKVSANTENANAIGIDMWEGSNLKFTGLSTEISSSAQGGQPYSYAVQNYSNKYGELRFQADRTKLTAIGGMHSYGAHVYQGQIYFEGDTTINASGGSFLTRGVSLQGDIGYDADKTMAVFTGDNITINVDGVESYGLYVSGSYAYSTSKNMVINTDAIGILGQYSSEIVFGNNSSTTVNARATDKDVIAVWLAKYAGAGGALTSRGNLTVNASGNNTYGVLVQDGSALNVAHLDVTAAGTAQTMAMGVEGSTDVTIGAPGQTISLRATGTDSMGLFVDGQSAVQFQGNATIAGDTFGIYNDGAIKLADGNTVVRGNVAGTGSLTVAQNASLDIGASTVRQGTLVLDGTVYAALLNDQTYGRFYADTYHIGPNSLLILNNAKPGNYSIFNQDVDIKIDAGFLYTLQQNGADGFVLAPRSVSEIADVTGLTPRASALGLAMAHSTNPQLQHIYQIMTDDLRPSNLDTTQARVPYYNAQADYANPLDAPLWHSVATSLRTQVTDLTSWRMDDWRMGEYQSPANGLWVQGMYNKAKHTDKFSSSTNGFSFGIDSVIQRKFMLGLGYANNKIDIDAPQRDINGNANTLFGYAQYKPNNWFINTTVQYTMADYTENGAAFGVALSANYDADFIAAQMMTGYATPMGLTPLVGARYLHLNRDGYANEFVRVSRMNSDLASGVAGVRYARDIYLRPTLKLRPTLSASATYDFVTDDMNSTVTVPGVTDYRVAGSHLSRMGGEFGVGMNIWINHAILSLNYTLDVHQDYTSQTGMLRMKMHF